ncbi:beta strand repeat-containing protein, partial [Rickettsia asembonensis]
MDFNGKSATAILNDGVTVTGDIDDILGGNLATLNFVGGSTVTDDVGASHAINTLNVQGDNTTQVNLQGNVMVNKLNFSNTGVVVGGGTLTATAGVQYNNLGATLAFSNPVGAYIFSSPILQAGNGNVLVDTTLTATDSSIAPAKTIQIGANFSTAALTLAVNNPNLNLLAGGNQINFESANAALVVASPVVQAVTLGSNLDGFAGGGGNVTLNGTNALTVQGGLFGTVNKLASVSTIGTVQAQGGINLSGITTLNVTGNSNFTDQTATSASATNINIGDGNGIGTYILTPNNANFNISTANMKFNKAGSILNITSNGNVTATMNGDLNPGAAASGVIQLSSTGGLLTIIGGNNLGINNGNTLNSMILAGNGDITITLAINIATPLSTGIAGNLTLTTVNGPVNFTNTTTFAVTNITGKTDFVNNAGIINLNNNGTLAAVTSTGGINGTVNVLGAGVVTINGASSATNLTINNAGVVATAAGGFTGNAAVGAGQ